MSDHAPSLLSQRAFRLAWFLTRGLPARRVSKLRNRLLRFGGATVGSEVVFGPGVIVMAPHRLVIGNRSRVARDACIDARGGLEIGENSMIGFESVVLSETHKYDDPDRPIRDQGMEGQAVRIGSGVWLGARVFVMPGRTIGDHAIVGAGSIVTRDVEPRNVVVGNPAKVLRVRDVDD